MNGAGKTADRRSTRRQVNVMNYSARRLCEACKVKRSIAQFKGDSKKCIRCVNRGN